MNSHIIDMTTEQKKDGVYFVVFQDLKGRYMPVAGIMMDDDIDDFIKNRALNTLDIMTKDNFGTVPKFKIVTSMEFPMDIIEDKIEEFRGVKRGEPTISSDRHMASYLREKGYVVYKKKVDKNKKK